MAKRYILSPSPKKAMQAVCERQLATYLPKEAVEQINKAYFFAEKSHRGQSRRSGESYIFHPIQVASILAELNMDKRTIMAALLHDVVEDTAVSLHDLKNRFGEDVANLVDGVTKISKIEFESKEHAEAENFRKMLMAMSEDVRVIIIKLADRLHNMRTLDVMRRDKKARIARQTLEVYAPIAQRLGLYHWSREMQDLGFKHLYPNRYSVIGRALLAREGNRKLVVEKLKTSLQSTLEQSAIEDYTVKGRRKAVYSIYKKMLSKRHAFDDLHDIYGFRIIVNTVDECYRVLGIIHNAYKPFPGRFDDYIALSKDNGYQSLHTVVFGPLKDIMEVQIRTVEMDQIAEAGIAAHWLYKSESPDADEVNSLARQWLLDLLDPDRNTANPVEFLEHLKTDLYPDEVYVFTPKGDIRKLPKGATALDFAYAVHTAVGNQSKGAVINKSLATLPTVLNNGDLVEILTSKRSKPTTAWLSYAVTARAQVAIRNYLKRQTHDDAMRLGKRLLASAMKQRFFVRKRVSKPVQEQLLQKLKLDDWNELLTQIGLGERLPEVVARQVAQITETPSADSAQQSEEALVIRGSEGLPVTYSRCCYPIPGDVVTGVFTSGHGLAVHTADCPNIVEFRKSPEKCLTVEWGESLNKDFVARLQVRMNNVKGAFAKAATAIAENGSNINHVNIGEAVETSQTINFLIEVKNRVHLAQVIKAIRRVKDVTKVIRLKG